MISLIVTKDLKAVLTSPKFTATFAVFSLLMLLSVFVGIREYHASVRQFDAAVQLANQEMREQPSWMGLSNRIYRRPDPMEIFVSGVNYDIGRWSGINSFVTVKLEHSSYSDDPIFAFFRFVDFNFIVTVILSLLALLFTYDAVNGERESGTLQLSFSNPVSRAQYICGKLIGSWLGLIVPLTVPVALSVLLLFLYRIPFGAEQWLKFGLLLVSAVLYVTAFAAIGIFASAMAKQSKTSFLVALVIWVVAVLIIPRAGVIVASQIIAVPTEAEMEGQQDAYAKQRWEQHTTDTEKRWVARYAGLNSLSKEEREKYRDDHLWRWMEEDDSLRKIANREIDQHAVKLQENLRNRQKTRQDLGFALARVSPASSFQLAAMNLAGTSIDLKAVYEDAMRSYRDIFIAYTDKKQKESGGGGGIRISFNSETGFTFDVPRERGSLNLSELPQFQTPVRTVKEAVAPVIVDFGLLTLYAIVAFALSFVVFLRYDIR